MARILAGDNLLAQWTYSTAQAQHHAAAAFAEVREQNRGLFIIVSANCVADSLCPIGHTMRRRK